jgi:hypothetical protein
MRTQITLAAVVAVLAAGGGFAADRRIIGGTQCVAVQSASDPFANLEAKRRHDIDKVLRANPDQ